LISNNNYLNKKASNQTMEILCFDMDNTLVYGERMHIEAFKHSFKKNKLPIPTKKELLKYFSLPAHVMIKQMYPGLTDKQVDKVVKGHDQQLLKETVKYTKVVPGAKAALKKLKKHYKIAVLSNCKHITIKKVLKQNNIDAKMFDLIIGNDDVKKGKPAPDEIFKAEKLLHVKKGYMVGDSIYDIQAANKAGLKGIAVLTGNHTKTMLKKEKPWKILNSVKDLPDLLLK
tara:strand:- start:773 stop:1459 length:687 start_codon:yes stop_codon:yes gene_type:complete